MKRTFSLYLRFISIQIRSQMQYRASFILDVITHMLLNGSYFLTLALVLQRFGNIKGWTVGDMAFLCGMTEMGFGLMDMIFSGFDPDTFSPMVRQGRFDQFLLRPMNITVQVLGSKFVLRRLGRVFEGLILLSFGVWLAPVHWTLLKVLYVPVLLASQVMALGALFMAGSTLTFWTIQSIEAVNIVTYGGNEVMSYPMTVYPGWMQRIFTYIIPFIFLNYYPALFFLDKPDPLGFPAFAPFLAPLAGLAMLLASLWFWKFGLKHYQSTGS